MAIGCERGHGQGGPSRGGGGGGGQAVVVGLFNQGTVTEASLN